MIMKTNYILPAVLLGLSFSAQIGKTDGPVTFNSQIASIIYQNCSSCHRPGEAAPFSLLSYQEVARKGRANGVDAADDLVPRYSWQNQTGKLSFHRRHVGMTHAACFDAKAHLSRPWFTDW